MTYNDQLTKMDRMGKKIEVECSCEDPYLEIARENMRAVELKNELEAMTQHND